jgi:hypothetical protein
LLHSDFEFKKRKHMKLFLERKHYLMVLFSVENGLETSQGAEDDMEKEYKFGAKVIFLKENGKKTRELVNISYFENILISNRIWNSCLARWTLL